MTTIEDGVYIGLSEEEYFAAGALGSTDLARLYEHKEGWWWSSDFNPRHVPKETDAMSFGTALHALLLEGEDVFLSRYDRAPAKEDFGPDLVVTVDDIKSALDAAGAPGGKSGWRKGDWLNAARLYLCGKRAKKRDVWDLIVEDAQSKADQEGKRLLPARDWEDLFLMRDTAMEDPEVRTLIAAEGGVRLPETSVIYTIPAFDENHPAVRLRFRFDQFLPQWTLDLKSIDAGRGNPDDSIRWRLQEKYLIIQAAWSWEMRARAYELIRAGKVFGGTKEQRGWISQFPDKAPVKDAKWAWIFHQRPNDAGRAPIVSPVRLQIDSELTRLGLAAAREAIGIYEDLFYQFGETMPWRGSRPMKDAAVWEDGREGDETAITIRWTGENPVFDPKDFEWF